MVATDAPIRTDFDALLAAAKVDSEGRRRVWYDEPLDFADSMLASAAGPDVIFEPNPAAAAPPSVSLLSSAYDVTGLLEAQYGANHWLNGIVFEPEAGQTDLVNAYPYWWNCPESGGFSAPQSAPTSSGTQVPGASTGGIKVVQTKPSNVSVRPLIAHTSDPCISTFGMFGRDAEARARRLLEANLPQIVENEFWSGLRATTANFPNPFLTGSPTPTQLNGGTAVGYLSALAELEQGLNDRLNEDGFIHASSRLVTLWIAEHAIIQSPSKRQLFTLLGTRVVPGSGYPRTGPSGTTAPTRTSEFAYATGPVMYARNATRLQAAEPTIGGPHMNSIEAERIDFRAAQDRKVRAECDFAVFHDKKVNVVVKVDLSTRVS